MTHRTKRGHTLMELLVLTFVMLLIGGAVLKLMAASYDAQYQITNQNASEATAREAVDTIVDGVRGARTVVAAGTSDLTWADNTGRQSRYWLAGTSLMRQINGLPTTGQAILTGVSSLRLQYGLWNGTAWAYTTTALTPGDIGAVTVSITGRFHEQERTITGSTRIRQQRRTISGTTKSF